MKHLFSPERTGSKNRNLMLKKMVARVALVAAGATGILGGATAVEAATGHEQKAAAESYNYSSADAAWCRWPSRWKICYEAGKTMAKQALDGAQQIADQTGWGIHNGGADAWRHCYWSARMTTEFGPGTAEAFGTRHENAEDGEEPSAERDMDLHNNEVGREIGLSDPNNTWGKCLDAVNSGQLTRLEN